MIGARIHVRGRLAVVTHIRDYAPGEHPDSPIDDHLRAREWVTPYGSRWSGLKPNGVPYVDPTKHTR